MKDNQEQDDAYFVEGKLRLRKPFWVARMTDLVLKGLDRFYSSASRERIIETLKLVAQDRRKTL